MASSHNSKSLQSCGSGDRRGVRGRTGGWRRGAGPQVQGMAVARSGRSLGLRSPSWSASFSISSTFSCTKLSSSVVLAIHSMSGRSSTDTASGVKGSSGTPSGWLGKEEGTCDPCPTSP